MADKSHLFQPGHEKKGGRVAGVANKTTGQLKDMILQALDKAGGVSYLVEQAHKNPAPFLTLVGKVLPMQVTGSDGGSLVISWQREPPKVIEGSVVKDVDHG